MIVGFIAHSVISPTYSLQCVRFIREVFRAISSIHEVVFFENSQKLLVKVRFFSYWNTWKSTYGHRHDQP